jgi:hypothetical protein
VSGEEEEENGVAHPPALVAEVLAVGEHQFEVLRD